jgi:serine/threonine-protein kinase
MKPIACSRCGLTLSVAAVEGKTVECPQCGSAVPVSAGNGAGSQAQGIETPATAARELGAAEARTLPPALGRKNTDGPKALLDATGETSVAGEARQPGEPSCPAIAGYEILEELGRGGMGVVYKAWQVRGKRLVALKMILAGEHAGPEAVARFRTEAEAAARLVHPHIVQVHEIGEQGGLPFFSLEFVDGGSLAAKLDGTPLPTRKAAELVLLLARAVEEAHRRGVIHRDLKPANILLTADGQPKITDFGLAKLLVGGVEQTRSGAILGTPSYMAPEQAEGNRIAVGPATDIYALGAILYECLTGRPPFKAESPVDTVVQVVSQEPVPPHHLQPKTPKDLETICLKCLHKQPNKRYATAADLADDLQRFLSDQPIRARPVSQAEKAFRWCRRNPLPAGLAAALGLVLLLGFVLVTHLWLRAIAHAAVAAREKTEAEQQRTLAEAHAADALRRQQQALAAQRRARQALDDMSSTVVQDWLARQEKLTAAQRSFLERALSQYEELAREAGDTPEARAAVAGANHSVGLIRWRLGLKTEAEKAYARAAEILEVLAGEQPTEPSYRSRLADAHNNRGVVLRELGRREEALAAYQKAIDIGQGLLGAFPGAPAYRRDLASRHYNSGHILRDLGRSEEAVTRQRQAIALQTKLVEQWPEAPAYQADLGRSYTSLGFALRGLGKRREPLAEYQKAIDLQAKLVARYPAVRDYRDDLANSHTDLGIILRALGRREQAMVEQKKAFDLRAALAAEYPGVPAYRKKLASSHNNLGVLLRESGRTGEALTQYQKAHTLRARLVAELPALPEYRRDLGSILYNLGNLLSSLTRRAEALDSYQKGIALQARLVADFSTVPDYRKELARSHRNLGHLLEALGRPAEARVEIQKSIDLRMALVVRFPTLAAHQRDLASSFASMRNLLRNIGQSGEALAEYRKGVDVLTALTAARPDFAALRAGFLVQLGDFAREVRRRDLALESYSKAIAALEPVLAGRNPSVSARTTATQAHSGRARTRGDLGDHTAALADWDRALAVSGKRPPSLRLHRALCQARLDRGAEAVKEAKALPRRNLSGAEVLDLARLFALAAGRSSDGSSGEAAAAEAVGLLQQARKIGWFRLPGRLQRYRRDRDFAPLLVRKDHAAFLTEAEKQPAGVVLSLVEELTDADAPDRVLDRCPHRSHPVKLQAGKTYAIEMGPIDDLDLLLRVEDSSGKELARDNGIGSGQARIVVAPPKDDTYRLLAISLARRGKYALGVRELDADLDGDGKIHEASNARLVFRQPQDGTYRLVVTSADRGGTGSFSLCVREEK